MTQSLFQVLGIITNDEDEDTTINILNNELIKDGFVDDEDNNNNEFIVTEENTINICNNDLVNDEFIDDEE